MRLLAPTRRTLNAKGGETKPVPNSELVEFRRLASEYAKEANSEISRLNLAKKEHEENLAKMEKERLERITQADAQERELSIKISSLQSKVEQLEASADAEKYRGLIKHAEASLKEVEEERESLRNALTDVENSRQSVQNLSSELDEREEQLNSGFEQLVSARKEAESKREQAEKEIALKLSELSSKEGEYRAREDAIFNKEHGIKAIERSLELAKASLESRAEEISRQERLIVDRRAKLESLIAYYERKTR